MGKILFVAGIDLLAQECELRSPDWDIVSSKMLFVQTNMSHTYEVETTDIKLDLGCGLNKRTGFIGVDFYAPDADVRHNLFEFPYPWKDDVVAEIVVSHFLEHVPQQLRWPFFEELWRILKVGGIVRIDVPNWKSERAYGDMTHEWPPVTVFFFHYLNQAWREQNRLNFGPYALKCNFDSRAVANGLSENFRQQSSEAQQFAITHYAESFQDLQLVLTKTPMRAQ